MKRTLFLITVILLVTGCHQSDPKNPYNLPIAATMEEYLVQVKRILKRNSLIWKTLFRVSAWI